MPAMQVTATQGGSTQNGILLRVMVLTGAADVQNGATAALAVNTNAACQTPITTTVTGSRVYGAMMKGNTSSFTANANSAVLDNVLHGAFFNRYGTCKATAATGTPGATSIGASAPAGADNTRVALLEVLPNGVLAEDPSAPAAVSNLTGITVTTAAFTPPQGALLAALVSSDGDGGTVTMTVNGGGLVWTEAVSANTGTGSYAGVWTAVAPPPDNADSVITVTETGGAAPGLIARMVVLTGAAARAAQTGNTATQSGAAAHQASITTTQTGSIVYGALANGAQTSFTAAASTTLSDNFADGVHGNQYGTCRTTAATGSPGAVTAGASAPTALGGAALAEILPVTPGGTITVDGSSPAAATTTSAITVQINVTPPPGSLLVLMISCDGGTGTIVSMAVSGGGLTWVARSESHASGQMYSGVWIADIPAAAPPADPLFPAYTVSMASM